MESEMTSRIRADLLEERLCELIDGKRTPGSGSKSQKGDVRSDMFLGEAKYRAQGDDHISVIDVDLQWLETIWEHARREGKIPLLAIETRDQDRAVLLPLPTYLGLGPVVPNTGIIGEGRSFRVGPSLMGRLPVSVRFTRIEVDEPEWVILSWGEMLELRRGNQPQPEKKPTVNSGSSFKSRPTRWTSPAPWRKRRFR